MKDFNGPYITHKPDIKTFDLKKNDLFLILGTDGLWDELSNKDVTYFFFLFLTHLFLQISIKKFSKS